MLAPGTVLDVVDHSVEVIATPQTQTARYLSGRMVVRLGGTTSEVAVGEKVEAPRGQVQGFLNTGSDTLVIESEVIFPDGYDPMVDLMRFAELYDRVKRERRVNEKTGEPPMLQMAVLTRDWRRVIRQPGVAGLLMPALAAAGRLAGYRPDPFAEGSASR